MNRFERLQPIFLSKFLEMDPKPKKENSNFENNLFSRTKMNDFLILTMLKGVDVGSSSQPPAPAQDLSNLPTKSNSQSPGPNKIETLTRRYERMIPINHEIFRKYFKSGESLTDLYGMSAPTNKYITLQDTRYIISKFNEIDNPSESKQQMKLFNILKIKDLIALINKLWNSCLFNNEGISSSSLSNLYELMHGRGLILVLSDTEISSKLLLLSRVMPSEKVSKINIALLEGIKKFYDGFASGTSLNQWQDRVIHENLSTPAMVNFQHNSEFFQDFMPQNIEERNNLIESTLVTSFYQVDTQSLDPIAPHLTECFVKRANEYHLALQNRGSDFMAQCVATCDFLDIAEEILIKHGIVYVRKKIDFPFVHDFEIQIRGKRVYLNLLTESKLCFGTPLQLVQSEMLKIFSYKEGFLPCPDKMIWFWPSYFEITELFFEKQLMEFLNLALDGEDVMHSNGGLDLSAPNGCAEMMSFKEMQAMLSPVIPMSNKNRAVHKEQQNKDHDFLKQSSKSESTSKRFERNKPANKEKKTPVAKNKVSIDWTDEES